MIDHSRLYSSWKIHKMPKCIEDDVSINKNTMTQLIPNQSFDTDRQTNLGKVGIGCMIIQLPRRRRSQHYLAMRHETLALVQQVSLTKLIHNEDGRAGKPSVTMTMSRVHMLEKRIITCYISRVCS